MKTMKVDMKTMKVDLTARDLHALIEYYDKESSAWSKAGQHEMAKRAAGLMQLFAITKTHLEDGRYDTRSA